jgi:small subunit ribosomal protein S3Ae
MVKKVVEKWRTKEWYSIKAPKMFNEIDLGEVTATSPENLINRVLKISLKDITRDFSHVYTTVKLRVSEVRGKSAFTKFIGHEIAREWLATMVQRRREIMDFVMNVKSKDGVEFVLKAFIATEQRCSGAKRKALRKEFSEFVKKRVSSTDFQPLIMDALIGKLAAEAASKLRRITQLNRVEIRATELKEDFDIPKVEGQETATESAAEPKAEQKAQAPSIP